jgi:hypothetical protein
MVSRIAVPGAGRPRRKRARTIGLNTYFAAPVESLRFVSRRRSTNSQAIGHRGSDDCVPLRARSSHPRGAGSLGARRKRGSKWGSKLSESKGTAGDLDPLVRAQPGLSDPFRPGRGPGGRRFESGRSPSRSWVASTVIGQEQQGRPWPIPDRPWQRRDAAGSRRQLSARLETVLAATASIPSTAWSFAVSSAITDAIRAAARG